MFVEIQNERLRNNLTNHSSVKIFFSQNMEKKDQIEVTKTTLANKDSKEFIETNFELESL